MINRFKMLYSLSTFLVIARAGGSEQLAFGGCRNGWAGRANSVEESALPGLKGLGCSPSMPEYEQADTNRDGCQQGNQG